MIRIRILLLLSSTLSVVCLSVCVSVC